MKRSLLAAIFLLSIRLFAQNDSLIPNYNGTFYPAVLPAAKGVAMPFLVDQKYFSIAGASVADSSINYAGSHYHIHNYYLNPATTYYVASSQYSAYDISSFSSIWPTQCPNILYNSSDTSFNSQSDCVGYLTRLLSVTGNTTTTGNAYLNIINTVHTGNTSHFAAVGYVSTAYSFAVAFPTLSNSISNGWQYVAGNIESSEVNTYNHTIQSSLGTYNGVRKGGFAQALPGDILAFGYSAASSSNGHVMVMETSPQLLNADSLTNYFPAQTLTQATALLSTYHIYSMPVFDCSGQMAHFRDSRKLTSGIGHGKLLLLTALTDDAPMGFIFDTSQVTGTTLHYDTLGTSVYAISVGRFVAASTSGIQSIKNTTADFQVYPNPVKGIINVKLKMKDDNSTLVLTDMMGNTVKQFKIQNEKLKIDVSDLAEGVYTITIINNLEVLNKKIIIVR